MVINVKQSIQILCNKICPHLYNAVVFYIRNGYLCNLSNPNTFNEKIQWRKYKYYDKRYQELVDKYSVRKYIQELYPDILVKNFGIYDHVEDVNFDSLPNSFILKPTHGFGKVIICKDKSKLDLIKTKRLMSKWISYNQYKITGEWQYRDIKPRIICDELLGDNIIDYKFFCFDGKPYYIQIDSDRYINHKRQLRDIKWNRLDCILSYPADKRELNKPECLTDMIKICEKLSKNFDFVRVDLFLVEEKIFFSELTFTPGNGMDKFTPKKFDYEFGELWRIT